MIKFVKEFIKAIMETYKEIAHINKILVKSIESQNQIIEEFKEIRETNRLLRKSIEKQSEVVRRLDSFIQTQAGYQTAITDFMKFREDVEKEEIKKIAAEKIDREPTADDLRY